MSLRDGSATMTATEFNFGILTDTETLTQWQHNYPLIQRLHCEHQWLWRPHLLPPTSLVKHFRSCGYSQHESLHIAARIGALTAQAAHQEEERRLSLLQNRLNETIGTTAPRLNPPRTARQCQRCQSQTSQLFQLRTASTSDPDTQAIAWHTAYQIARRHPTIYRSQKGPDSPQPPEDILRCAIFRELQPHGVHLCFGCISCAIIPLSGSSLAAALHRDSTQGLDPTHLNALV